MNILNIRIDVNNNIARGNVKGFPQIFTFTFKGFKVGKNFVGIIDICSKRSGDFNGFVC